MINSPGLSEVELVGVETHLIPTGGDAAGVVELTHLEEVGAQSAHNHLDDVHEDHQSEGSKQKHPWQWEIDNK